jgi:hypothetical protein
MTEAERGFNAETKEGRCNWWRTGRGYCHARPLLGATRCGKHGGHGTVHAHERRAQDEAYRAEIAAAIDDPKTMDVRGPIAAQRVLLERVAVAASEDEVLRRAQLAIVKELGTDLVDVLKHVPGELGEALEELLTPTVGDLEAARRAIHYEAHKAWALHGRGLNETAKTMDWTATMRTTIAPLLEEFGFKMGALVAEFVPPADQDKAYEKVATLVRRTIGAIALGKPS